MSEERKWNTENTCKLIELYRAHSLLWDPKNKDYKNRYKKADALKEICMALNMNSMEDVEKKIRNINGQYSRERRDYKKLKKLGAGKHFTSKWFGYELLSFLRDKNKPRKNMQAGLSRETHGSDSSHSSLDETEQDDTDNMASEIQQAIESTLIDNTEGEYTMVNEVAEHNVVNDVPSSILPQEKSKVKNIKEKRKNISQNMDPRNEEVYKIVTSLHKDRQERLQNNKPDKFDIFGELVAQKLRGLCTLYAQSTVEHLIHNLLYEAEIGKYNEPNKPPSTTLQNQLQQFLHFRTPSSRVSCYSDPPSFTTQHSYSNPPSVNTQDSYSNPPSINTQDSYSNPPSVNTQHAEQYLSDQEKGGNSTFLEWENN